MDKRHRRGLSKQAAWDLFCLGPSGKPDNAVLEGAAESSVASRRVSDIQKTVICRASSLERRQQGFIRDMEAVKRVLWQDSESRTARVRALVLFGLGLWLVPCFVSADTNPDEALRGALKSP